MATEEYSFTHPDVVLVALQGIQAAEDEEARDPPPPRGVTLLADGSIQLPSSKAMYASIRAIELATIRNPQAIGSFILNPEVFKPDGSLVTGRLPAVDKDAPQLLVDPVMAPLRRDAGSTDLNDLATQAVTRLNNLTGSSTTQETLQEPLATAGSNKSHVYMKWTPRPGEASNQTTVVWFLEMNLDTAFGTVAFDEFAKHAKKPNSSFAWSLQRGNRKTHDMKMVARNDTIRSLGLTTKDTPILHGRLVHDGDKANIPGDSSASKATGTTTDKDKDEDDNDNDDESPMFTVTMQWTPKDGNDVYQATCKMEVGEGRKLNSRLVLFEKEAFKPGSVFVWEHNGKVIDRMQTVDSLGVDPSVEINLVATLAEEIEGNKPSLSPITTSKSGSQRKKPPKVAAGTRKQLGRQAKRTKQPDRGAKDKVSCYGYMSCVVDTRHGRKLTVIVFFFAERCNCQAFSKEACSWFSKE